MTRVVWPSLALIALTALLVALGLAVAGPAHAAAGTPTPTPAKTAKAKEKKHKAAGASAKPSPAAQPTAVAGASTQHGAEVRAGEDVVVPKGNVVPSVVTFGGDVTVDGRVTDAVVAFGGDITVNGRVGQSVVAFGGDVTIDGFVGAATVAFGGDVKLGSTADVGSDLGARDASIVLLGGDLTRAPGAHVHGLVKRSVGGFNVGHVIGSGARAVVLGRFLGGFSFFGWLLQTAFCLILALVMAALMPGQLRRVQTQLRMRPWASLGWGVLTFFVAVPLTFLIVGITIIGLVLWLPLLVFVLLTYFFGSTALVALLAQKALTRLDGKENLMLAVVLGVVVTTIVSRVPVAGAIGVFLMIWIGTGGVVLAAVQYRRERKEAQAAQAAANAALAAAGATYAQSQTVGQPVAVITPMVQTSPSQEDAARQAALREAAARQAAEQAARAPAPPPPVPGPPPQPPVAPPPGEPAPASPQTPPSPESPPVASGPEDAQAGTQGGDRSAPPEA